MIGVLLLLNNLAWAAPITIGFDDIDASLGDVSVDSAGGQTRIANVSRIDAGITLYEARSVTMHHSLESVQYRSKGAFDKGAHIMSIPGFTAETTLYKRREHYYMANRRSSSTGRVVPAIADYDACLDICSDAATCWPLTLTCLRKINICRYCKLWYRGTPIDWI
jgi:hypothetical protein